ncbi:unnamed protein product, partial [Meganyctiphanes norvegica]
PDVLELLVQNGANLHARTKNQETPYDICEDAELRDRIMQLINEQETKRIHDQNRRIRRVHSNTRTQSVRRHSIREKTLTPKKEAQEEARIRMQMDNSQPKSDDESPELGLRPVRENLSEGNMSPSLSTITTFPQSINNSTKSNKVINNKNITNNSLVSNNDNLNRKESLSSDLGIEDLEKEDRGRENVIPEEEEEMSLIQTPVPHPRSEALSLVRSSSSPESEVVRRSPSTQMVVDVTDSVKASPPPPPPRTSSNPSNQKDTAAVASAAAAVDTSIGSAVVNQIGEQGFISQIGEQGGSKIDIHVTVTVNPFSPGTLSDLKKQRALSRASQSSYTLAPASSTYSLSSPPPEYESHMQHSKNSPEFNASSIRVDSVSYRPPPSPTLTPRKFCGDPNEIIGGVDSRSCCSLM